MSFSSIRNQALSLENQTVGYLATYSSYIQSASISSSIEEEVESQIEQTLLKRENLIKKLGNVVDNSENISPVKLQQFNRHKEILQDHKHDFQRMKSQIQEERNRSNLLNSVRTDLEEHRNRSKNKGKSGGNDEMDYYNEERKKANNANSVADMLIDQAYRTRDEMNRQNGILSNANKKIVGTLSHIPVINGIIKKIGTRRRRDSIIMAGVITFCIIVFFFLL